jgi:hypothetical protein
MTIAQIFAAPVASIEKADPVSTTMLIALRDAAATEEVRVTHALRATLAAHPAATRVAFKHAAILVGINWRTARNTFDRVARGA